MGSYAYLTPSPVPRAPATDADWDRIRELGAREFESKYLVPIFWLAMFTPADACDGGLVAETSTALATLARRRRGLERLIGDAHHGLLGLFTNIVAELAPWVVLRLEDLEETSPRSRDALGAALAAAAELEGAASISSAARAALGASCGLSPGWQKSKHVIGILSGHAPGWPPPPSELAWREAMGRVPASAPFRDFDASTAWTAGDPVRHLMFGDGVVSRVLDGGARFEVVFRDAVKMFARTARPPVDPYAGSTPLGRFLRDPTDEAALAEVAALDPARAELMDRVYDLTDEKLAARWKKLVGPLARVLDPILPGAFRRGFLSTASLQAPDDKHRGRAFLRKLGGSGEALLRHPLWRTVEQATGAEDDMLLLATHPNLVSLREVQLDVRGLARLAAHPEPVRIAVARHGRYGLSTEPRDAWAPVLEVGALVDLRELQIAGTWTPDQLAWLLDSPLGRQLRVLELSGGRNEPLHAGAWYRALVARGLEAVVLHLEYNEPGSASSLRATLRLAPGAVHVQLQSPKLGGDAYYAAVRAALAELPPALASSGDPLP